jgi:hypothetical protein
MAFSKQPMPYKFQVANESKQILAGPLMVADLPMERVDKNGNKFYVTFPAKVIFKIVKKIRKQHIKLKFNLDHNPNNVVNDAYLVNDFIVSQQMGITTPVGFDTLTDGSWFGFVHIEDKAKFEEVKNTRTGFSV